MKIRELITEGLNRKKVRDALWAEWQQDAWAGDEQTPEEMDDDDYQDFENIVDIIVAWGDEQGIANAAVAVARYVTNSDQNLQSILHGGQGGINEAAGNLNKLHKPAEYKKALKGFALLHMVPEEEAVPFLQEYIDAVDNLIAHGGTVYRAVWVAPGKKPNLKDPGEHWTLSVDLVNEYFDSNAGWSAHADFQGDNDDLEPEQAIIAATVGPNNITNRDVLIDKFPEEQEVSIVNPKLAKYKLVKA